MRNPGPEDLVYLSGGENREFDVADFPKLGKRMVRTGNQVDIYDAADAQPFGPHQRTAVISVALRDCHAFFAFHAASTAASFSGGDAGLELLALLGRAASGARPACRPRSS